MRSRQHIDRDQVRNAMRIRDEDFELGRMKLLKQPRGSRWRSEATNELPDLSRGQLRPTFLDCNIPHSANFARRSPQLLPFSRGLPPSGL